MDHLRPPMRNWSSTGSALIAVGLVAAILAIAIPAIVRAQSPTPSNAGHALAEKFAKATDASADQARDAKARAERQRAIDARAAEVAKRKAREASEKAEARRRSEELDMLARARAEAAVLDTAREPSQADPGPADPDRGDPDRAEVEAQLARVEAERVARAAWEAAQSQPSDARGEVGGGNRDPSASLPAGPIAGAETSADDTAKTEAERKALQAAREAETLRIVDKLRAARAARAAEAQRLEAELADLKAREATQAKDGPAQTRVGSAEAASAAPVDRVASGVRSAEGDTTSAAAQASSEASQLLDPAKPSPANAGPATAGQVTANQVTTSQVTRAELPPAPVLAGPVRPESAANPPSVGVVAASPGTRPQRATVILMLTTGGAGLGRTGTSTADPVLCLGPTCYLGQGADRPAKVMSRGAALGPGNTLGARAAACARSLTCVFRDVEIDHEAPELQPVDLRLLRHDRREVARGVIDLSCTTVEGRLNCKKPVVSKTWHAWIVPEDVAVAAGPDALRDAADARLRSPVLTRVTSAEDRSASDSR